MQRPIHIDDLPPPQRGRKGFPWTVGTTATPHNHHCPKITLVTPSFQQGHFLEETLRSVLLQGYPNLEYFVMDGGSTDHSLDILKCYSPFLTEWASSRDAGQTNAINKGFARSTGDILGYLNSDDLLLPNALHRVADAFTRHNKVHFVTGFRKVIDTNSRVVSNFVRDPALGYYLRHYCAIAQETTFWRRLAWLQLGELDESFDFAMDYEYWLRALAAGHQFHTIPSYLGAFRDHAQTKTRSQRETYFRDMRTLYRRYAMGQDQAAIQADLGPRWRTRYAFYTKSGEWRWTDSPRLVMIMQRLMEMPFICDVILATWKYCEGYRKARQAKLTSFRTALSAGLSSAWAYICGLSTNSDALIAAKSSRDVAHVTEYGARHSDQSNGLNQIVIGSGWYPLERYETVNLRWCSGRGRIGIVRGDGLLHTLRLHIATPLPSGDSCIELYSDRDERIAYHSAKDGQFVWRVALPQSQSDAVWYELRWRGLLTEPDAQDPRTRAFCITEVSWDNSASIAEDLQQVLHRCVSQLLFTSRLGRIPIIGRTLRTLGLLRASPAAMLAQTHLWKALMDVERKCTLIMDTEAARSLRQYSPAQYAQRDAIVHNTTTRLRCVIDCSTYYMNNNGDKAMLTMLIRRIRANSPDAFISVITNDPSGMLELDPTLESIVVGDRSVWQVQGAWLNQLTPDQASWMFRLQSAVRRAAPKRFWGLVRSANGQAGRGGALWQRRIHAADAVFLMGGGYFTDAFSHHAIVLLTTLDESISAGKCSFIVGCGFEPVADQWLSAAARVVLPQLKMIGCREGVVSPALLERFGVCPEQYRITGDDAVELAYEARPDTIGTLIGVNIRNHCYNCVSESQVANVRQALLDSVRQCHTKCVSLPISNYQPSDAEATGALLHGIPNASDYAIRLDTPQTLLRAIAACRLVVTGSYHAAVFALSMGIPAICLYASSHYYHKMTGLLTLFGGRAFADAHLLAIDAPRMSCRLNEMISNAWREASSVRSLLLKAARTQMGYNREFYDSVFQIIADARGQNAKPSRVEDARLTKALAERLIEGYVQMKASTLRA